MEKFINMQLLIHRKHEGFWRNNLGAEAQKLGKKLKGTSTELGT